jgi:Flp pilus assembly protein TadD
LRAGPGVLGDLQQLGLLLARQGRAAEALWQLGKAVELDPGNAEIRNNLGVMLVRVGRYDDAVIQFREALTIDPRLREAPGNLDDAIARSRQGGPKPR